MRLFLYLNYCMITVCILIVALFGLLVFTKNNTEIVIPVLSKEYKRIDKKWVTSKTSLSQTSSGPLALKAKSYSLTLPNLRDEILFYGKNMRPDLKNDRTLFFVGLEGQEKLVTIEENSPLYLRYQPAKTLLEHGTKGTEAPLWGVSDLESRGSYCFSQDNRPTPLWIELKRVKNSDQAQVALSLVDENHKRVQGSEELSCFRLKAKNLKQASTSWELGNHRVDTTLLVRQKARFVGEDLFLQMHGGADYAAIEGLYRLDFLTSEKPYSCFVKEGDILIWDNDQWHVADKCSETENKPLLVVKKINERIMSFDLWNEIGNQSISLNLMRLKDHYGLPNITSEFQFIQAKTWARTVTVALSQPATRCWMRKYASCAT